MATPGGDGRTVRQIRRGHRRLQPARSPRDRSGARGLRNVGRVARGRPRRPHLRCAGAPPSKLPGAENLDGDHDRAADRSALTKAGEPDGCRHVPAPAPSSRPSRFRPAPRPTRRALPYISASRFPARSASATATSLSHHMSDQDARRLSGLRRGRDGGLGVLPSPLKSSAATTGVRASIVPSTSSGACLKLPSPAPTNTRSGVFLNRSSGVAPEV